MTQSSADILWLVVCGLLVFFMQAGFALLETGLTRAKNAVNVISKNLLDFCCGSLAFWAVGYALMYGDNGSPLIGWDIDLVFLGAANAGQDAATSAGWFFQMVFAATAATIVSGAVAERTKLIAYVAMSVALTALIYPVAGHWIWGSDGWLAALGMRDFAGSTVVHSVGAWAALAGAIIVGPRLGKFRRDGTPNALPGHSLPMAALGTFILWFGWYAFNAGSTLAATPAVAHIGVTTTLAASAGSLAAMLTTLFRHGKPDLSMGLNGALGGLVGITAGCASVSAGSAVVIGLTAGLLVYCGCMVLERRFNIDDPVGAIAVHGVCGMWGTAAVGLFGQRSIDIIYWDQATAIRDGLFYGGGLSQVGIQMLGIAVVGAYAFSLSVGLLLLLKATVGVRVSADDERLGLDIIEHGMSAYPSVELVHARLPADAASVGPSHATEVSRFAPES